MTQHYSVSPEQIGMELDEFLCRLYPLASKRRLRQHIRDGLVLLDGATSRPSMRLRDNSVISVEFEDEDVQALPEASEAVEPPPILFEDEHVLLVDKPAHLLVEPDRWDGEKQNLIGALHALSQTREQDDPAGAFRPRLVHRLDKDTSGVLLVAKSVEAERVLGAAFENSGVAKTYLALVEGEHPLEDGASEDIELAIGPDLRRSGQMCAREDGKPAVTRIQVEQRFRGYTLLRCEPRTGRTHQIRVHLAAKGFPLAVDPLYGRRKALLLSEIKAGYRHKPGHPETPLIDRLTLHALSLEFPLVERAAERARVEAPIPRDLERTLKQLAKVRAPRR